MRMHRGASKRVAVSCFVHPNPSPVYLRVLSDVSFAFVLLLLRFTSSPCA